MEILLLLAPYKTAILFGIYANIISALIKIFFIVKITNSMNDDEINAVSQFMLSRKEYIRKNNSIFKLFLSICTNLIPTYTLWLNTISIFAIMTSETKVDQMQKCVVYYDKYNCMQVVKYASINSD